MLKKLVLILSFFTTLQFFVQAQTVSTLVNLNQGTMGDGITVAHTGDIFYSSGFGTSFNKIFKITPEGEFSVYKENISNPVGIIADSLLNLYVPTYQGNSIRKIDTAGVVTTIASGLNGPAGVVLNKKGELFISEYGAGGNVGNAIKKINTDGTLDTFVTHGSFANLIGITIDENENLYTSNWSNGNVYKITPDKEVTLVAKLGANINQISYSNGYLLLPTPLSNKIYRVDVNTGEIILIAGTGKSGNKDGISIFAEFSRPNGIAPSATGDTLYVNDGGIVKMITGMSLPRIRTAGEFKNKKLNLNINAEIDYDSLQILIDDNIQETFYTTASEDSNYIVNINVEETKQVDVYTLGFTDSEVTVSSKLEVVLLSFENPAIGYKTDFDDRPDNDFLNVGFSIQRSLDNFRDYQAHSVHDYRENLEYTLMLRLPVLVHQDSSILTYNDIAIVEPGEEGSVFGTPEFKDYVVVEGNKGGGWVPLSDGYDARKDSSWQAIWPGNGSSGKLFRSHIINLKHAFSTGDTILVRFRMYSDDLNVGYGWVIGNIDIQSYLLTHVQEEEERKYEFKLDENYPNPFNPSTVISYSLSKSTHIKLSVFDINGREVAVLIDKNQNAGNYSKNFDATGLSSGVYFYQLITETGFMQTNKMLLIK